MKAKGKRAAIKTPRMVAEDAALQAVGKYLESLGWSVAVISADRIQGPIGYRALKYEMVFRFLGVQQPAAPGPEGAK